MEPAAGRKQGPFDMIGEVQEGRSKGDVVSLRAGVDSEFPELSYSDAVQRIAAVAGFLFVDGTDSTGFPDPDDLYAGRRAGNVYLFRHMVIEVVECSDLEGQLLVLDVYYSSH